MEISQSELTPRDKTILKHCEEVMEIAYELYLLKKNQNKTSTHIKEEKTNIS